MPQSALTEQSPLYAAFVRRFIQIFSPQERAELQPQILGLYRSQPNLSSDQFVAHLLNSNHPFELKGASITLPARGITLEKLQ